MRGKSLCGLLFALASGSAVAQASRPAVGPEFPDLSGYAETWVGPKTGVRGPRYAVIGSRTEWTALWREHDPTHPVPPVEFRDNLVVCVCNAPGFEEGFRISQLVRGSLMSDQFSYNVILKPDRVKPHTAFHFVRVARTRFDFRFYGKGKGKEALLTRVDPVNPSARARAVEDDARELVQKFMKEPGKHDAVFEEIVRMGEPARPVIQELHAEGTHWGLILATQVLKRWLEDRGKAREVRSSEAATQRVMKVVRERVEYVGDAWWIGTSVRCENGIWYLKSRGTFMVSSDMATASQDDLWIRVALRAVDGEVLAFECKRGMGESVDPGK